MRTRFRQPRSECRSGSIRKATRQKSRMVETSSSGSGEGPGRQRPGLLDRSGCCRTSQPGTGNDRRASTTRVDQRVRPAPTWAQRLLPNVRLGPGRWNMGHATAGPRRRRRRRAIGCPQENQSLVVAVGPVGAVGKRAPGWPGVWCAVVQGRRATTVRAHALWRHVRVVVLGPSASTGHLARAPRSRSRNWLPSACTRSAPTRFRPSPKTAWAVENLIKSDPRRCVLWWQHGRSASAGTGIAE